jgi:transcriptional regulator with XRE-family HTH domain
MLDRRYLDRTERFVDWLESKRRQSGLTQDELAKRGGISKSFYSKIVTLRRNREKYGDDRNRLTVPGSPETFRQILTELGQALGEDCLTEGMRIWGYSPEGTAPKDNHVDEELIQLVLRVQRLPPEKKMLVLDLIDHIE